MLDMTDGIQRIVGYPTDEIVGNRVRTFTSIMCELDVPAMDEVVGKALESRTDASIPHPPQQGHYLWVTETGGGVWGDRRHAGDGFSDSRNPAFAALPETARRQRRHRGGACGTAGTGFALLASEMRALANDSEAVARQIATAQRK